MRTSSPPATADVAERPAPSRAGRRIAVVLLILAAIGLLVGVGVVAKGKKDPLGQLRVRDGTVEVRHPQQGFASGSDGEGLTTGDDVRTANDGQAQVDYFDGSLTRLDSRTSLELRQLSSDRAAHRIALTLDSGRIWNRVKELTSSNDLFEVRFPGATATVHGTTFAIDCRTSGRCFAIGVDSVVNIKSSSGQSQDVGPGDCEAVLDDGSLERCDANKLGLTDGWIRENLAEDQQLTFANPTPTPTPTPSPEPVNEPAPVTHHFVPRATVRPPIRTPSKTAPPSTPAPTKDHNDDGVVTTPGPIGR